ncbi:hypothetical protein GCK72_022445 [Caenorhabditis remanei]|uniref:Uncharacterized protein n=1 Tax=Caenorhabditis remanei TaxID=31234 RepID=A0A6A5FTW0_CAERE|nr:hypothetical protein GCK72_022445 [Caenorhabditis remanei]KAF1745994.1 hypothetical protein GCK72_022445 [Caenorhabditis remanei]
MSKLPELKETLNKYKNKNYNWTRTSPLFIIPIADAAVSFCVFEDDKEQQIILKVVSTREQKREGSEVNPVDSKKARTT